MRRSTGKILTTHVGALPGPAEIWNDPDLPEDRLRDAVAEAVKHQRSAGIDIINEGELTKGGSRVTYVNGRLGGFDPAPRGTAAKLLLQSQDWFEFGDFYQPGPSSTLWPRAPDWPAGGCGHDLCSRRTGQEVELWQEMNFGDR